MSETPVSSQDIVARAGRYYRNARYVICAMALAAGLWFGYDGFYNWPRQRDAYIHESRAEQVKGQEPHSETDIALQCWLAGVLIPLAPILLGLFLYRSRGEYRLSGTTLDVPGHPPVPVDQMLSLDMSKWKRKGIAYLTYRVEGSDGEHRLKLDDFVYAQIPTDQIVEQLDECLNPEDESAADEEPADAETDQQVDDEGST
ncbi:MAG TPA: hypothetical protein VFE47_17220 [Tepidisphaeraceae bacterium]|jgi:hypothetical protein|nr:hypothetical protein [Tepidisphaeraceae bacterium]